MVSRQLVSLKSRVAAVTGIATLVLQLISPAIAAVEDHSRSTRTPIQHVIVIIGENRTFDHVFATYKPKKGESVDNLLSKGIVNEDGTPGPNFALAAQSSAIDSSDDGFRLSPSVNTRYSVLPPALAGGYSTAPFPDVATAKAFENGLPDDYYVYLTTGGTGLAHGAVDTRIPNADKLPNGPFQLTSATHPYDTYDNSPVHRFYQMWQQFDCKASRATRSNPSGCKNDLWPWVETTIGAGSNGKTQPSGFNDASTGEGSTAMGFYNVLQGDAPYFKFLADKYAMSDNFHQSVDGWNRRQSRDARLRRRDLVQRRPWTRAPRHRITKWSRREARMPESSMKSKTPIRSRAPTTGTRKTATVPAPLALPPSGGGTYSECADTHAPGVSQLVHYLRSLPKPIDPNCEPGHYYLLNNYNPGYYGDGRDAYADITNPNQTVFTIPPSTLRTIGDALNEKNISWAYYGDQWNAYLANPDGNYVTADNTYCNICNPFQYVTSIMTNASGRAHNQDTTDLYDAIKKRHTSGGLVRQADGWLDGHPASSKLNLFEGFVKKIVDGVKANPKLWSSTAIIVTFDEGGGYYDSGYIQPLDFFGDGSRIPTIVVSPWTKPGHISHTYTDHVSILKFIEANWKLSPVDQAQPRQLPQSASQPQQPLCSTKQPRYWRHDGLVQLSPRPVIEAGLTRCSTRLASTV